MCIRDRNEGLHGVARAGQATVFPQAIGMAAAFDRKSVAEMAGIVATEGRAKYNAYSVNGDRDIYKGLDVYKRQSDIIVAVGYENNSYFHRVFKEHYHMTPRAFRVKNSEKEQLRL